MSSSSDQSSSKSQPEFDLTGPNAPLERLEPSQFGLEESEPLMQAAVLDEGPSPNFSRTGWRGLEDLRDDDAEDLFVAASSAKPKDELDMTPMVDVTFLLLIFFMVTASFTMQLAFQQPASGAAGIGNDPDDAFVEVAIDETNTFYVTTDAGEEIECRSVREMRELVRDAQAQSGTNRLVIRAHVDSLHRKLVNAWEAGVSAGMDKIVVQPTDIDFE